MKGKRFRLLVGITTVLPAAIGMLLGVGCSTAGAAAKTNASSSTAPKSAATVRNGPQLWARNCGHCHNIRSPDSYSDGQWDVAMLHMRMRANLTAEEHKQILVFLKSAH